MEKNLESCNFLGYASGLYFLGQINCLTLFTKHYKQAILCVNICKITGFLTISKKHFLTAGYIIKVKARFKGCSCWSKWWWKSNTVITLSLLNCILFLFCSLCYSLPLAPFSMKQREYDLYLINNFFILCNFCRPQLQI